MSTEFNEMGRKSKGWWLQKIKDCGQRGSINRIKDEAKAAWVEADRAVKALLDMGYLQESGNAPRKRFHLSSIGHRYLNEHQVEAQEAGIERRPEEPRLDQPLRRIPTVDEPLPEDPSPTPPPASQSSLTLHDQFNAVLIDILLERYADKVTAAEVMERLSRDGH